MTYEQRKRAGDPFELLVKEHIEAQGYTVQHHGIEKIYGASSAYYRFVVEQSERGLEWAMVERYRPDLFCWRADRHIYCDPKNGNKIERNSYEVCRKLEDQGIEVVFAIPRDSGGVQFLKPSQLRFEVPTPQNNVRGLPVVDEVWRSPRTITATWTAEDSRAW